ncbi:MAG: UDP-N-acetylmuramoyl-L-alanine--D-glutamate ligase [Planctomycetes bacterium]|nr:UDP-N-acetylmuramoyl-L-alanine--D-glutamate ligase [Planctomycetota bacterium]
MIYNQFFGKKVLIMGLGLFGGGAGAVKFFATNGAKVTVTDLKPEKELKKTIRKLSKLKGVIYHLGRHHAPDFEKSDLIVVNPSVPTGSPYLKIARKHKILLETEMNLFFRLCPARIIGITGSNGKTTTTALLGEILRTGLNQKVWVGGNIGRGSLLAQLNKISSDDIVVLELSSFQLDDLGKLRKSPFLSVILNIQPNHLDRHGTMENYSNAKKNIIRYQDKNSYAVLNKDDKTVFAWSKDCLGEVFAFSRKGNVKKGGFIKDDGFYLKSGSAMPVFVCRTSEIKLLGDFNQDNILAAITAANILGVPAPFIAKVVKKFKGVEHRLEFVREFKGVRYYNDSIATNPESTIGALRAISKNAKPKIILIAGGYDKKLPFDDMAVAVAKYVRIAVLVGATAGKIRDAFIKKGVKEKDIIMPRSFDEAVHIACRVAKRGETVLLSPSCASYDMFNNFAERGNLFKKLVMRFS